MNPAFRFGLMTLALLPVAATAQKPAAKPPVQQVIPPDAVYWLSAATSTGFVMAPGAAPSTGDMMRMAMGGGGANRSLTLDLGSRRTASGPPSAQHAIPPAMAMGPRLLLKTPKRIAPTQSGEAEPEDFERPKGRLLLFWGCGEKARPGQPVVIDFAKMAAGQVPPGLFAGERVRIARPPAPGRWTSYGGWPNDDEPSRRGVPANASLIGAHKVTGTYTPDIDFTLSQDFMGALVMRQTRTPAGAIALAWNQLPQATAHFAQMFGGSDNGRNPTVVFWSSSEAQTFFSALGDYIAPTEAARLVGTRQLMPPAQTSCAIPREAVAAAEGGMLTLVAHGPEQNVIHPPRSRDPAVPWKQDYAVKARFVSRAGGIIGMDEMMGGMGETDTPAPARRSSRSAPDPNCVPREEADALRGMLGGVLGGKLPPICP